MRSIEKVKLMKCGITGIVTGAIMLTSVSTINLLVNNEFNPFFNNAPFHKVVATEYSKNGVNKKINYERFNNYEEVILLKTPYSEDNGSITRKIYTFNAKDYYKTIKEYIISNIDNQKKLLQQDFIQELIQNSSSLSNFDEDQSSYIPSNNSYEISYVIYNHDYNDSKLVKIGDTSEEKMVFAGIYGFASILAGSIKWNLINSKEKQKKKIK